MPPAHSFLSAAIASIATVLLLDAVLRLLPRRGPEPDAWADDQRLADVLKAPSHGGGLGR